MTTDAFLPTEILDALADTKPSSDGLRELLADMYARADGNYELMAQGGAWAALKLSAENELLKRELLKAIYTPVPKVVMRGRKPIKPRAGLAVPRRQPKTATAGAPVQHGLPLPTKNIAEAAYRDYFEQCGGSATDAAKKQLEALGVDTSTEQGKSLTENIRRKISDAKSANRKRPNRQNPIELWEFRRSP